MHTLSIDVEGETVLTKKTLSLFDSKDGSIVPLDDVTIRGHIAKCFATHEAVLEGNEGAVKVLNQVKRYYRALGRLMIHSLATGHVLPSHVMPPFFRAYFFCDSRPRDGVSYASPEQRQVLFHHIQQLGFANFDVFKYNEDGEINEVDQMISCSTWITCWEGRSIAISSILDGLVLATGPVKTEDQRIGEESPLEAAIDLRNFFLDRSIQAVNEILFAPDDVSGDVIIKNLKGKQMENYTFSFVLNDDQTRFMTETLPNLLRRKEKEEQAAGETNSLYTRRFLKYVTGLGFINRNMPDISIVFAKDIDQNSRPHAYTCEQALDIPFGAYGCDETVLETYLEEAFLQSGVKRLPRAEKFLSPK
ncbi:hypothetical protein MHU86_19174 [Fragilaria crotonensis]|nr:hypothetical protein MHU86_19174 [Fragilaria crotonensis]